MYIVHCQLVTVAIGLLFFLIKHFPLWHLLHLVISISDEFQTSPFPACFCFCCCFVCCCCFLFCLLLFFGYNYFWVFTLHMHMGSYWPFFFPCIILLQTDRLYSIASHAPIITRSVVWILCWFWMSEQCWHDFFGSLSYMTCLASCGLRQLFKLASCSEHFDVRK